MKKHIAMLVIAAVLTVTAGAVQAQGYSDAYLFLKAVREHDGAKAADLISTPGSIVINTRDRTNGDGALHYVVRERDRTWLGFLLNKGAKVDLQNNDGLTPLALAAQSGWLEGAQVLLSYHASVDLANRRGETPLILAVQQRDITMVRLLLAQGANPALRDRVTGYSAIDQARRDNRGAAILKALETNTPKPIMGPAR